MVSLPPLVSLAVSAALVAATPAARAAAPPAKSKSAPAPVSHAAAPNSATFPHIEASFRLADDLHGANPFDYTVSDVQVTLAAPRANGTAAIVQRPAFWDGDGVWRVRYTPRAPGLYKITAVTLNGHPAHVADLAPAKGWTVTAVSARSGGFVRRDPNNFARFVLDDGSVYYPVGHDVAWSGGGTPPIPVMFDKMGKVGENWSRVWMDHWDGKNLDWAPDQKIPLGQLSLEVARKWDGIVEAAERNGIRFQMTLQHHGPYSSRTDSNWKDNPWNTANGGFLATPQEFFTNPKALALTRAKYRYIVARWGYSPSIMAWELFNEVQWTDAVVDKQFDAVDGWHRDMAAFLRAQDVDKHLVTTSSDTAIPGLFRDMDYVQPHSYTPDVVAAVQGAHPGEWRKPIFFGETGGAGDLSRDRGETLHAILWGSIVSESSGAAEYWAWDTVEKNDLYGQFAPVTAFLKTTGLPAVAATMHTVADLAVSTPDRGQVSFGPGGGWGKAAVTTFPVSPNGTVAGITTMPGYLQGQGNRALFPNADFPLVAARPATLTVRFGQSARNGAHPRILVDGTVVAEKDFPASPTGDTPLRGEAGVLTAAIPAGKHVVRLDNTGADWAHIDRITLAPFGPSIQVIAKAGPGAAVLWVRRTAAAATGSGAAASAVGSVTFPDAAGMQPGRYRVVWWDTQEGVALRQDTVTVGAETAAKPLTLAIPAFDGDVAAFVGRLR